jgi:acyl transferase domain-containing protein
LYVRGLAVDWVGFAKEYKWRKVQLPTYPFQRQRFWVDAPIAHPFTSTIGVTAPNSNGISTETMMLHQQLAQSDSERWSALLIQYLQVTVARILAIRTPAQIDPTRSLLQIGLDSLAAIELHNQIKQALPAIKVPITAIIDASIQQIATLLEAQYLHSLLTKSLGPGTEETASATLTVVAATPEEMVEEMVEEMAEEMVEEFIL